MSDDLSALRAEMDEAASCLRSYRRVEESYEGRPPRMSHQHRRAHAKAYDAYIEARARYLEALDVEARKQGSTRYDILAGPDQWGLYE